VTKPPAKLGRPRKLPPANAEQRVRELSAAGWGWVAIATRLGTSLKTLNKWREEDPALQEAFDQGREQEHFEMLGILRREAGKGNVTAALAILNARHGWRTDQSDNGNRVNVTIALPGAMTLAQFNAIAAPAGTPTSEKGTDQ
jgi:hypothetical protein